MWRQYLIDSWSTFRNPLFILVCFGVFFCVITERDVVIKHAQIMYRRHGFEIDPILGLGLIEPCEVLFVYHALSDASRQVISVSFGRPSFDHLLVFSLGGELGVCFCFSFVPFYTFRCRLSFAFVTVALVRRENRRRFDRHDESKVGDRNVVVCF
jgi:hypothetical protein